MCPLKKIFSFLFFLLVIVTVKAQEFTTLTWNGTDILPYTQQINLGPDYANYRYTVSVDYPEYQYLSDKQSTNFIQLKDSLSEEIVPQTSMAVSAHKGIMYVSFLPLIYRNGKFMHLNSFKLNITKRALVKLRTASSSYSFSDSSVLKTGKWVKIRVSSTGIYKLTNDELLKMGFTDASKVRLYGYGGNMLPEVLASTKTDDLPQVPLWRGNNYVLFYAKGPTGWTVHSDGTYFDHTNNPYSSYGYYFLTQSEDTPASFPSVASLATADSTVTSFSDYSLYEVDSYNWASSGRELYDSYDYSAGNTKSYSFAIDGITSDKGYCTVDFAAHSSAVTSLSVAINGTSLGSMSLPYIDSSNDLASYYKATTANRIFSWTGDKDSSVKVTLVHTRSSGVSGRLNYIALNYRRTLKLYNAYTFFRDLNTVGATDRFQINNATSNTVVWNVTDATAPYQVNGTLSDGVYTVLADNSILNEYVVLDPTGSYSVPETVKTIENQDLHELAQADMVILVPESGNLTTQAELLAQAHRDKDGMTVHVVRADQIYNEFSSGTPDATAYRWFMKMFYDRSTTLGTAPKYLLLFGDCSWDNRMISSSWSGLDPKDFLLCYESVNSTVETSSCVTDDYFGMLDWGEGAALTTEGMDVGVGRFPLRTASEAKDVVTKVIAYMDNDQRNAWKNNVCFSADDGQTGNPYMHMAQAEKCAQIVENGSPQYVVNRVYEDAYKWETTSTGHTYKLATKRLLDLIKSGQLLVNYTGHGSTSAWSAESLLTTADIKAMSSPRQALWVTATCDFCRFDDVSYSAGDYAFLNASGGAIALFTTSRVVFASGNSVLNQVFTKYLFTREAGSYLRLGDIMRLAKCDQQLSSSFNKLNFTLIGDPALKLSYPEYSMVMDSVDQKSASTADLAMKAGQKVTIVGHVQDTDNNILTDYTGKVYATVYDSKETVETLNNDGSGVDNNGNAYPFTFEQYSKKLFVGSDSLRQGYFKITIPVPIDISYSNQSGMINLYGYSNTHTKDAAGYFTNFTVGGTSSGTSSTDTIAPKITLYLNSSDFVSGDKVNKTPMLIARLYDSDGINASGNGVGHDIEAIVDDSSNYTYTLNNYYTQDFGDYTKGTVAYSMPTLTEGEHTLFFRCWDTMNHSSTKSITFNVVSGLIPELSDLVCYPNPASTSTTFSFTHNRPGTALNVTIEVFDLSGRTLWSNTGSLTADESIYTLTWDLNSNNGWRLSPGVYLYRANISCDGSKSVTKTRKIVILAQ